MGFGIAVVKIGLFVAWIVPSLRNTRNMLELRERRLGIGQDSPPRPMPQKRLTGDSAPADAPPDDPTPHDSTPDDGDRNDG